MTVKSEGAVQVNFTLVRSSTDSNNESKKGKGDSADTDDVSDPTTKEFEALIKDLSAENGLERLMLRSSSNLALYRYHSYKDLSEFLRGLVMNYPLITNLTKLVLLTFFFLSFSFLPSFILFTEVTFSINHIKWFL